MVSNAKHRYYLEIARTVASKSTCLRRQYGAIIVNNDEVIATGYNGSPRGAHNCTDLGFCVRTIVGASKGDSYHLCTSVHAEQNAIISASRREMVGATIYIVGINVDPALGKEFANPAPCIICERMIINAGIRDVYGFTGPIDTPEVRHLCINPRVFTFDTIDNVVRVLQEETDPVRIAQLTELLERYLKDEPENVRARYLPGKKGDIVIDGTRAHGGTGATSQDPSSLVSTQ